MGRIIHLDNDKVRVDWKCACGNQETSFKPLKVEKMTTCTLTWCPVLALVHINSKNSNVTFQLIKYAYFYAFVLHKTMHCVILIISKVKGWYRMGRKTIDLPDDLSEEIEEMHRQLKISQVGLLTIAGYSLVARYKTHGTALFENPYSHENDNVTLIKDGITQYNIQYVKDHIADFGEIASVRVYNVNNVPDRYRVPEVNGEYTYYIDYKLIITNNKGHEWWFAGCTCGYGGEGVRGTHQILTLLGIPYRYSSLTTNDHVVIVDPRVDNTMKLAVVHSEKLGVRQSSRLYHIDFPDATKRFEFERALELLGFVTPLYTDDDMQRDDKWAAPRNLEIIRSTGLEEAMFYQSFYETLSFMVDVQFHGEIIELTV